MFKKSGKTPAKFKYIQIYLLVIVFVLNSIPLVAFAQSSYIANLISKSSVLTNANYDPQLIIGMNIDKDDPFKFEFLVSEGDAVLSKEKLKDESLKMIKYFMTALTVPEDEMWVNLSPYEKDRIIPEQFGFTEMGCDLLAQDYILKQLTSSLIHPDLILTFNAAAGKGMLQCSREG